MQRRVVVITDPVLKKVTKDKQAIEVPVAFEKGVKPSLDGWRAVAEMEIANEQRCCHG